MLNTFIQDFRSSLVAMDRRYYTEGYGCPSNDYDLQIMLSRLHAHGYSPVQDPFDSDIIIVNTCAVKKRTEDRALSRLRLLATTGKPVVIAGCLSVVDRNAIEKAIPGYAALLSPFSVERIDEILEFGCRVEKEDLTKAPRKTKIGVAPPREGSIIETVPISEGCLGECSFCCTRLARGRLLSYSPDLILKAMKSSLENGTKEFWLTGQDVGSYGRDAGWNLIELLNDISSLDGDFKVRLGMLNPETCIGTIDELVEAIQSPKFFKFVHLPMQSGNNRILSLMKRKYNIESLKNVVTELREKCPGVTLWTDIICGYPEESRAEFEDTLNVLSELTFDVVNVSRFSARPGTPAQQLKPMPSDEVKDRSRTASRLWKELALTINRQWIGWRGYVLVDEAGTNGTQIGRTDTYKPVVLGGQESLMGKRIPVEVVDAWPTYLVGNCIEQP